MATVTNDSVTFRNGTSEVNGIKMYYEIYGQGKPLYSYMAEVLQFKLRLAEFSPYFRKKDN